MKLRNVIAVMVALAAGLAYGQDCTVVVVSKENPSKIRYAERSSCTDAGVAAVDGLLSFGDLTNASDHGQGILALNSPPKREILQSDIATVDTEFLYQSAVDQRVRSLQLPIAATGKVPFDRGPVGRRAGNTSLVGRSI